MARLWQGGAELNSVAAGIEFTSVLTNAPAIESTIKRSGNHAWRVNNSGGAEGLRVTHTTAGGAFYFRFYAYVVAMPSATAVIGGHRINGAYKVSIRLTSAGLLQLFNSEDNAQVGSNSSAISTGQWYRIEIFCDSTTLASTAVEARAFVDTPGNTTAFWNPSGTVDLTAFPGNVAVGTGGGDTTLDIIYDDLAVNDNSGSFQNSWCGEGEIIHLYPNGNGDNSQWTGSDGNSTDNYLLVDEFPPDDATTYVQSNTSGQIDDYNMEATPAALGSTDVVNVVAVGVRAAAENATSTDPDITLRIKAAASGSVDESASLDVNSVTWASPEPLSGASIYRLVTYDLPGSASLWTKADLDTAQAGIRESATDAHFARVSSIWISVDHKPSSGTLYTQSVDGGITPAGAIFKDGRKNVSGGVTPTGAVNKSAAKMLSGALSSIVGTVSKSTSKFVSGAITSIVGTLDTARVILKELSGSITPSGSILKLSTKTFSGGVTPSGDISKVIGKSLSGALSSIVGTLSTNRGYIRSFTGEITPTGSATKLTSKSPSGSLTPSGAVTKTTNKALSGAITSIVGTLSKSYAKVLSGTLTLAGTVQKQTMKFFSGVLTLAGDLIADLSSGGQTFFQDLSGTLTSSGTLTKSTLKSFAGTLVSSGALAKTTAKNFAGTLTSSGALTTTRVIVKVLEGTLAFQGTLLKLTSKNQSGTLTSGGTLSKFTSKALSGAVTSSGLLTVTRLFVIALQGTLTAVGTIEKSTLKLLSGEITPTGAITRGFAKVLTGTLGLAGSVSKFTTKTFSGVLNFVGTVTGISNFIEHIAKVYLLGSRIKFLDFLGQRILRVTLRGEAEDEISLSGNIK